MAEFCKVGTVEEARRCAATEANADQRIVYRISGEVVGE